MRMGVVSAGTQIVMALPMATIFATATMGNDLFIGKNCTEGVDDHVNPDELRIVVNMTRIVVGCNICLREQFLIRWASSSRYS